MNSNECKGNLAVHFQSILYPITDEQLVMSESTLEHSYPKNVQECRKELDLMKIK